MRVSLLYLATQRRDHRLQRRTQDHRGDIQQCAFDLQELMKDERRQCHLHKYLLKDHSAVNTRGLWETPEAYAAAV